ncbi:MAG: tyrosine-protein phosphatase [Synergistaceae bacterium]|nr:tyrosine-protein phosphatase [Synergistaceae bacterium]
MKIQHSIKFLLIVIICLIASECYGASSFYKNLSKRFSSNREDYSHLSDLNFANFREVRTKGIAPGKLYRSYSPMRDNARGEIVRKKSQELGIKTFINLSDSYKLLSEQTVFPGNYYSKQRFITLNMKPDYRKKDYQVRLARGIKFMAANEAPYLVHCILGKDRTGFVCAILECLTGASLDEVVSDYLLSFTNYFGIMPGTKDYDFVANNEIRTFLSNAFGVNDIERINLAGAAERYLLRIGVNKLEIETLCKKLSH